MNFISERDEAYQTGNLTTILAVLKKKDIVLPKSLYWAYIYTAIEAVALHKTDPVEVPEHYYSWYSLKQRSSMWMHIHHHVYDPYGAWFISSGICHHLPKPMYETTET
jgi:hypothetical protein